MGKTFRYGEASVKNHDFDGKYPELISPRMFYNKISLKDSRARKLAQKRRTTYK